MFAFQMLSPGLIPDKEVRVSVKALAVSCIGAAAALHPEAFFNSLYLEPLDGIPAEGMDSHINKLPHSRVDVFLEHFITQQQSHY